MCTYTYTCIDGSDFLRLIPGSWVDVISPGSCPGGGKGVSESSKAANWWEVGQRLVMLPG